MTRGIHISFCGIGGAGKTTQAEILCNTMRANGFYVNHEHGFKPSLYIDALRRNIQGKELSSYYPDTLISMAHLLDLRELNKQIEKKLIQGENIITERFWLCSKVFSESLGVDQFFVDYCVNFAPTPDIIILLDLNPQTAWLRVQKRQKGMENNDSIEIMTRARELYLKESKNLKAIVINADRAIEVISQEIYQRVTKRMEALI